MKALTRSLPKIGWYSVDNYFREGCWTFLDNVDDILGVTLCVLKPEAAPGRRYRAALQALLDNDFRPVHVKRFRYQRLTIRETWRYQLNIAPRERIETMDLLLPSADSVLLVLKDCRWRPGLLPAAVRLTALKGPSDPRERRSHHLRCRLGAVNTQLNFIHTSDEPIDVVRELSVLIAAEHRSVVRTHIRQGHDALADAVGAFDALESEIPAHDLDLARSWERLTESVSPAGELARLRVKGQDVPLSEVLAAARHPSADPTEHWDLLAILTHTMPSNVPGVSRIFPNNELSRWQQP